MKFFGTLFAGLLLFSTMAMAALPSSLKPTELRTYGEKSPATLYVFTSFSCPHCATFHAQILPELLKYAQSGTAQIVLVEMPYDAKSMTGTMLARCLPSQNYEKFSEIVFQNQSVWGNASDPKSVMMGYAKMLGLSDEAANACLTNKDLQLKITEQRNNLSNLYNVRGMPTTVLVQGNKTNSFIGADKNAVLMGVAKALDAKK